MPFGNNHFSQNNEKAILESIDFFKSKDVSFRKVDFVELIQNTNIDTKSFVYLDPPYSITTGSYNENFGWTNADDKRLFDICHIMISKDIKFGMSNVILNKGIKNEPLIEFCKHKNLNIYSPKNFQYHACGLPNKSQQEVFICNYKPSANTGSFVKIDL